jgi:hypothetical protein
LRQLFSPDFQPRKVGGKLTCERKGNTKGRRVFLAGLTPGTYFTLDGSFTLGMVATSTL